MKSSKKRCEIIKKNKLKLTMNRLTDYRDTLEEIVHSKRDKYSSSVIRSVDIDSDEEFPIKESPAYFQRKGSMPPINTQKSFLQNKELSQTYSNFPLISSKGGKTFYSRNKNQSIFGKSDGSLGFSIVTKKTVDIDLK